MQYTMLINKNNPITIDKINKIDMVLTYSYNNNKIYLERRCLEQFNKLKEYLETKEIYIDIDSGYRTIEFQQNLFDKILKEKGSEYVDGYVSLPFYSEHHTALAIDYYVKNEENLDEDDLFDIYDKVWKELYKFGFILRYPKNKENITGYEYEGWHIRYVGLIPAKIIYENNLTLEEYVNDFGCLLYINKPSGITSHDVVGKIRHLFGIKRVGHTGTLDPLATGVMLVAVGKACKIVELLTMKDKEYIAGVKLGIKTDSLDITGNIIEKKDIDNNINIEKVLKRFKKTYYQEVPKYSAVKINGKKLYEYARGNIEIELPKRKVDIKEIELLEFDNNSFKFKTLVSKGCYIRSLINDISLEMNTVGTMTSLIRTKQGNIDIEMTDTIEDIENNNYTNHDINEVLGYPVIDVLEEEYVKLRNGVKILNKWNIEDKVIFYYKKTIIGIYEKDGNYLKTWKNW